MGQSICNLSRSQDEFDVFISTAEQFVTTVSEPGPPMNMLILVTSHEELKTFVNLIYEDTVELQSWS